MLCLLKINVYVFNLFKYIRPFPNFSIIKSVPWTQTWRKPWQILAKFETETCFECYSPVAPKSQFSPFDKQAQFHSLCLQMQTSAYLTVPLFGVSVFRNQHHCGHCRDGRGSRPHYRPPGRPFSAPQCVHILAGREQPAQHPAHLPGHSQAPSESCRFLQWKLYLFWFWRKLRKRQAGYSQGR